MAPGSESTDSPWRHCAPDGSAYPTLSFLGFTFDMRSVSRYLLPFILLLTLGTLTACDSSPSSVDDFDIQPDLKSPASASLVLIGDARTTFTVTYQGLDGALQIAPSGDLVTSVVSEEGSPQRGGTQEIEVTYDGQISGNSIVRETIAIAGQAGGVQIADTVSVSVAPFVVSTDFEPRFAVVSDYDERTRSETGGASATVVESSSLNLTRSTGVNSLEISDPGTGGSVTFERRASAPSADRFSFIVRPDPSTDFELTLTFTEDIGGGTASYDYTIPVESGDEWVEYGIGFDQINPSFDPVDSRAGGSGPLESVTLSADANVTYAVDDMMLSTAELDVVEVDDFEAATLEYSCVTLEGSSDVADESAGFTSRRVDGGGCFGYNYNGLKVNLPNNGVLSLRVKGSVDGDALFAFLETPSAAGGYNFDNGTEIALPAATEWTTVTIPLSAMGDEPSAIYTEGLNNVGFESRGTDPDFLIDDVQFQPAGN